MNKNINMNAARLLGLLQTDGNFNFFWEPDGRPKIVLTSGNLSFLEDFVTPWLQSQEINSAIEPRQTKYGVTYNLFVERKTQVLKLINLVDFLEKRKLILKKNINRLNVVKEVLAKYNFIYTDIHVTFDLIDQIEANFNLKYRTYPAAECKAIVQRYFDFNKKT